jgi:hypothetical protein
MKIVTCKAVPDGDWNLCAPLQDGDFPEDTDVVVVAAADFDSLVETMRYACSVAYADLLAMGAPEGSSTAKLLLAALAASAVSSRLCQNNGYDHDPDDEGEIS